MDRSGIIGLIIKNLLAFVVDVIKELKWQLMILGGLLIIKKSVEALLGRIMSVEGKEWKIRFDKQGLPPPPAPTPLPLSGASYDDFPILRGTLSFQQGGYPALRHRQNTAAYYYGHGGQYWSPAP
jgi:hypothetical protein